MFELLGHDNPLKDYPAPVVPVGILDDRIVAVYLDNDQPSIVELEKDCTYVSHSPLITETLRPYNHQYHRLFAFSESHVIHYMAEYEKNFFSAILNDSNVSIENPFLRLSLAKPTGDIELVRKELKLCLIASISKHPNFVNVWYAKEIRTIVEEFGYENQGQLPEKWVDLLFESQIQGNTVLSDTSEIIDKVFNNEYVDKAQLDILLKRIYEQLKIALTQVKNNKVKTFIEYEMARLDFLLEDYGNAEEKFNRIYESCILNEFYEYLPKIAEFKEQINWNNRYQEEFDDLEPTAFGGSVSNLFGL